MTILIHTREIFEKAWAQTRMYLPVRFLRVTNYPWKCVRNTQPNIFTLNVSASVVARSLISILWNFPNESGGSARRETFRWERRVTTHSRQGFRGINGVSTRSMYTSIVQRANPASLKLPFFIKLAHRLRDSIFQSIQKMLPLPAAMSV